MLISATIFHFVKLAMVDQNIFISYRLVLHLQVRTYHFSLKLPVPLYYWSTEVASNDYANCVLMALWGIIPVTCLRHNDKCTNKRINKRHTLWHHPYYMCGDITPTIFVVTSPLLFTRWYHSYYTRGYITPTTHVVASLLLHTWWHRLKTLIKLQILKLTK